MNLRDLARARIFHDVMTLDYVAVAQPNLVAGIQAVVAFRRRFTNILLLDPEFPAKGN
jgi:hypothetical protein